MNEFVGVTDEEQDPTDVLVDIYITEQGEKEAEKKFLEESQIYVMLCHNVLIPNQMGEIDLDEHVQNIIGEKNKWFGEWIQSVNQIN